MQQAELKTVEIAELHSHPDNPRLIMRADVVDGITANLNGEFPAKHAIHVRTIDGGYQILSGHHRVEAARKAGIERIPAWIDDIDDETAFMELVLSNNQGELSPLEIGMHALKAVPKAEGGRGKKGGLSEYAKRVGKSASKMTEYRQAAMVVRDVNHSDIGTLLDKTHHLAAIHAAAPALWEALVTLMLARNWTVADCKLHVKKLEEFDIPEAWQFFLDPIDVQLRYLEGDFSAKTAASIVAQADVTQALISAIESEGVNVEEETKTFHQWLKENSDGITARMIEAYRRELEVWLQEAREEAETAWNFGKWQDHIDALEDGSVALLLTDPPYGMEYQSNRRKLANKHEKIEGDDSLCAVEDMLNAMFMKLKDGAHAIIFCHPGKTGEARDIANSAGFTVAETPLVWHKMTHGSGDLDGFAPSYESAIHARKGKAKLLKRIDDVLSVPRRSSTLHPTEKPVDLLCQLIDATSVTGELVVDPFGGVASTLVAAKQMGRKYWGCEVDENYFKAGGERIANE